MKRPITSGRQKRVSRDGSSPSGFGPIVSGSSLEELIRQAVHLRYLDGQRIEEW
jgi:hypothetical protein